MSFDDLGFTQGVTITDRLRTFRQKLFRLEDHLRRFRQSCDLAYVPQPRPDSELASAATELIEANAQRLGPGHELSLAIFATPGHGEPTLGMQAAPLRFDRYRHLFVSGANLVPIRRAVPTEAIDPRIKHRSRLMGWIAQKQLHSKPDVGANAEPLITTSSGPQFVRETLIANFLCGMDGNLISPPRSEILNGVSLLVIEELCQSLGIAFVERELTLQEVLALGSECLITNTSFCLAPVAQIARRSKPLDGPIFRQLLNAWGDVVGVSIREQFLTPSV